MTDGAIVAIAGDLHVNSTTALCPPAINLDDGGTYRASKIQRWLWRHWLDYWEQIQQAKQMTGYPVVVVFNGELADDLNHRSTQLITKNTDDMLRLAVAALGPALAVADHIIVTRGTEAHAGASATLDEIVARDIGAIPDTTDGIEHHARWLWRGMIAGVRFHVAHHPGMGHARAWTRGGDANRIAAQILYRYVEQRTEYPDLAIFGHTHKPVDSYDNHPVRAIVFPSWQLTNAYGHRLGGDWLPVGAGYVVCNDGRYEVHKWFKNYPIEKWKTTTLDLATTN